MGGMGFNENPMEGIHPNARGEEVPPVDIQMEDLESRDSSDFKDDSDKQSSRVSSTISPHYNPDQDVILWSEFIRERQMKNIVLAVELACLAGVALLAVGIYWKAAKGAYFFMHEDVVPIVNLVFGVPALAVITFASMGFVRRVIRSSRSGKRWSHRRRRGAIISFADQVVTIINLTAFVTANGIVLHKECQFTSKAVTWTGFVQWTCWNVIFFLQWVSISGLRPIRGTRYEKYSDRYDAARMDVPFWENWRKLPVPVLMQGFVIACCIMYNHEANKAGTAPDADGFCPGEESNCSMPARFLVLVALASAAIVLYQLLWLWDLIQVRAFLAQQPYNLYRMGNQILRLQMRMRGAAICIFIASMIIFTWADMNSCASLYLSWLGYLPIHVVMTAITTANAMFLTPKRPGESSILQVWLQEFAWTEDDLANKKEERSSSLPPGSDVERLDKEPMWCFETAVKLMYWSFLCYDYEENKTQASYSVDTALSLYDLHSFEMLWEESMDTKCLIGYNDETVVISFRGTASMANVYSDIKVWRERWPKNMSTRKCFKLLGLPMVHSGFYHAYTANGFNMQLMTRLKSTLTLLRKRAPDRKVRVYVTGHSLGGALATLCAYDVMTHCQQVHFEHYDVTCYTFGAPRTGNHAFARLYSQHVPDTWHMINSDDTITRAGKFFFLYKRGGFRVLINPRGDLIVRPDYVEQFVQRSPGAGSIRDHYLTSYQKSVMAVLAAQFGRKSVMGGKEGVRNLARHAGTRAVLEKAGLTIDAFDQLEAEGLSAGLRNAAGFIDCSCANVSLPSWPKRIIDSFKPCRRGRKCRPDQEGVDMMTAGETIRAPSATDMERPPSPVPEDIESAQSGSMPPVLDEGDGMVCAWPKAIKIQQRHDMRVCRGKCSSTVLGELGKNLKRGKLKADPTEGTWCDSKNKEKKGTSTAPLPPVEEEEQGATSANEAPAAVDTMDRRSVSFDNARAGALSRADMEAHALSFSACGDDRSRLGSFVVPR